MNTRKVLSTITATIFMAAFVLIAAEASNGRPDELLGVDLLPALPGHQDDMADRGHRMRLCLRSGVIPRRTLCRWARWHPQ